MFEWSHLALLKLILYTVDQLNKILELLGKAPYCRALCVLIVGAGTPQDDVISRIASPKVLPDS